MALTDKELEALRKEAEERTKDDGGSPLRVLIQDQLTGHTQLIDLGNKATVASQLAKLSDESLSGVLRDVARLANEVNEAGMALTKEMIKRQYKQIIASEEKEQQENEEKLKAMASGAFQVPGNDKMLH